VDKNAAVVAFHSVTYYPDNFYRLWETLVFTSSSSISCIYQLDAQELNNNKICLLYRTSLFYKQMVVLIQSRSWNFSWSKLIKLSIQWKQTFDLPANLKTVVQEKNTRQMHLARIADQPKDNYVGMDTDNNIMW